MCWLAEDNPVNRELAVALLSGMGHQVEVAVNGHEVLAALERAKFDVVLMDLQMPDSMASLPRAKSVAASKQRRAAIRGCSTSPSLPLTAMP